MNSTIKKHKSKLIVGIDPGFTTGLAILNLKGELLFLESLKGAGKKVIIKKISHYGEPILISSDVTPTPKLIRKIAPIFNSTIFNPLKNLSITEKKDLVRHYIKKEQIINLDEIKRSDIHSQDALAAAFKAYKRYKNKFEKIEETIRKWSSEYTIQQVKTEVVIGYTIKNALRKILGNEEIEDNPPSKPFSSVNHLLRKELQLLRERIKKDDVIITKISQKLESQKKLTGTLKKENSKLNSSIETLQKKESLKIRGEQVYKNQIKQINFLKKSLTEAELKIDSLISRLKRIEVVKKAGEAGNLLLLKPIKTFSEEGINKAISEMDINSGDPIIILNASGGGSTTANRLIKLMPKFIIYCTEMSHQAEETFNKNRITLINCSEVHLKNLKGIPAINKDEVNKILQIKSQKSKKILISNT